MDVDSFIGAHSHDWKELEAACKGGAEGLASLPGAKISETIRLYLRVSTHLTLARSRYRDPRLERYLNELVGRARQSIYGARPGTIRGFVRFFGARYRFEIRRTAPYILVAVGVTVILTLASWAWVGHSLEARVGLIPPAAQDAINHFNGSRSPDLGPSEGVATMILFHNVTVALFAFALGITLGIGTIYLLTTNALLLGVLAGAFGAAGHGGDFWALILPHGILELTAICLAAGAGLRIGWSIVDPRDRARSVALSEEATGAVVVALGVVPAFVIAATIEGFVTGTAVPRVVQLTLGVVAGVGYILFLFGWWPGRRRPRRTVAEPIAGYKRPADLIAR